MGLLGAPGPCKTLYSDWALRLVWLPSAGLRALSTDSLKAALASKIPEEQVRLALSVAPPPVDLAERRALAEMGWAGARIAAAGARQVAEEKPWFQGAGCSDGGAGERQPGAHRRWRCEAAAEAVGPPACSCDAAMYGPYPCSPLHPPAPRLNRVAPVPPPPPPPAGNRRHARHPGEPGRHEVASLPATPSCCCQLLLPLLEPVLCTPPPPQIPPTWTDASAYPPPPACRLQSMLWETSLLDADEGIRFRGHSIPDVQVRRCAVAEYCDACGVGRHSVG